MDIEDYPIGRGSQWDFSRPAAIQFDTPQSHSSAHILHPLSIRFANAPKPKTPIHTHTGTNDKAGGPHYCLRWASPQSIKETFVPLRDVGYPYMKQ